MIEIKFRIRLKNKHDGKLLIMYNSIFDAMNGIAFYEIDRGEWGFIGADEYTGLKDKNGKEIYEGDITTEGIIYWNEFMLCWFVKGEKDLMLCIKSESVEIIGNIYENTELK